MQDLHRQNIYCDFYAKHIKTCHSDDIPSHFHDHIEIYILISGGKACLIDNKLYEIKPHDLLIFKPDHIHGIIRNENEVFERYIISASPYFLQRVIEGNELYAVNRILNNNENIIVSLSDEEFEELSELFEAYNSFRQCKEKAKPFYYTLRKYRFVELMLRTLIAVQKHKTLNRELIHQNPMIASVLEYIEANFDSVTLETLAQHFNVTKNYMCILFKSNTSMTVNNYILSKKITHAKKFLAEGKNVTETSELCGFSDSTNFIRVFKRYTNMSPKKYQIELKND